MWKLALAFLLLPSCAWAGIDMTTALTDENGLAAHDELAVLVDGKSCLIRKIVDGILQSDNSACPPLTLGHAIYHTLLVRFQDEKDVSGEAYQARVELAKRVKDSSDAKLSSDEISLIKRLIAKVYSPIIIDQAFTLLDPNAKPGELK